MYVAESLLNGNSNIRIFCFSQISHNRRPREPQSASRRRGLHVCFLKKLSGVRKLTTFYLTKNDHRWVTCVSLKTINSVPPSSDLPGSAFERSSARRPSELQRGRYRWRSRRWWISLARSSPKTSMRRVCLTVGMSLPQLQAPAKGVP